MARTADGAISYVLRDPKSKEPTPIIGLIRFNNDRIKVATGFKVKPAHWSSERSRVKNVVEAINKEQVNRFLGDLEAATAAILSDLRSRRIAITKELIRQQIDDYLTPKPEPEAPTEAALFSFIAGFIESAPNRINSTTNKLVGHRTIQKYNTVLKMLREFAAIYPRPLDFDTVDLAFYEAFTAYLSTKKKFTVNNVGKYIATLKVFLSEATDKGFAVKQDYRSRKFKVLKEEADNVYLSEAELRRLFTLDLISKPRLERVRDLFLVGCYTGLRFSDFTSIKPENVRDGFIRMEQFKTQGKVVIPCHPIVETILSKYSGHLPGTISNQKMNDYLKELCQLAGLTGKESKGQTKGGKRVTRILEKWELVSTHTARRSFATNAYLAGVPALTIMRITGHRTEKAFMQYIKLDEEQHAQVMALHWANQHNVGGTFKIA